MISEMVLFRMETILTILLGQKLSASIVVPVPPHSVSAWHFGDKKMNQDFNCG
jgi:hypothetical protein